ncbi:WW domain-containing protein [Phytophthora infestans]|uniref:WW domain-containing protein n=1 Tax=Phytophthora infestans TaxID=4787 RepID=A0A8S9UBY7_PHYIN|nr:WW domain-containing protein [Phytophthora infestans]
MLGGFFHKRKKSQDLRPPSLQDVKKFRDTYAKYAELRQVGAPPCFEKSIYKAIAGQKELHTVEFRLEDITDPQIIALAEALVEMPIISVLDLRDNRITDDGAKALLEVLRMQIVAAKTSLTIDFRSKQPLYPPMPEYTRYVTNVNLKGNEVSASVVQEFSQYVDVLRREDKRLEIRAALNQIDRNNDGRIDEEEFKGVLKLLTASTPTKKEIRAFMQQHTLSTDNAQSVVNLESVLLAKCAVSPSRHSACPPWESLVQERHAVLGAPRMASTMVSTTPESPDSSSSKARVSRSSVKSSSERSVGPSVQRGNYSDASPLSSPPSQAAPVSSLETKPPPTPVTSIPVVTQQVAPKVSESKNAALPSDQPAHSTNPPQVPMLPLSSVLQHNTGPSPRSARSSFGDGGHRNLTKPSPRSAIDDEGLRNPSLTGPSSGIPAPSSPHESDFSDSMSFVSPTLGGSISQRISEDHSLTELKAHVATNNSSPTNVDSSRWRSERFSGKDDEAASNGGVRGALEASDVPNSGNFDDDVRSVTSHNPLKATFIAGSTNDNNSVSGLSRREDSFDTARETSTKGAEYSTSGHDEKRSVPESVVSTPRLDLTSLVFEGMEDGTRTATLNSNTDGPLDEPEDDDQVEERIDSTIFDVTKDGKERSVVKLIHSEFRSGLTVKDFPVDLPFRNLLALLLPDNGLSDLALFNKCRFSFVTVLDLSRNKLGKLLDDGLSAFPRLEVLNLAENQLKIISGLTKTFQLRALGLNHNCIRIVKNIEHLTQLEILELAHNGIATVHALRILSLNNKLTHLNLDGNSVVDTDERQKRMNIVHVRNLLPALQLLGSIPLAHTKKVSSDTNTGKGIFEHDLLPDYKTLWVSTACDTLHIIQDAQSHSAYHSHYDDEWDARDEDGEGRPNKPLTREQQRHKDELRSRAPGFRSRGKAMPSPPKVKTSVFSFGPSQQPPVRKKKKKPAPADPSVVREQQRRASELSAPKYAPVDKTLMHQEQQRKSRVDFHAAMTVGERLQLAQDMTQRRPTATVGLSARSRSILAKAESRKRATMELAMTIVEEATEAEEHYKITSRPSSPQPSPMKNALVFRIDPADTPHSPKALTFRIDPYSVGSCQQPSSPKPTEAKEAGFLHDLAVSDFLSHAEEEFSTALTALNVLLAISEKEQGDRHKLAEYRASLDALDILNASESHELYKKAQGHADTELQCIEWFTKLGVVKKCMRQLLEKLEMHAPGSGVIRAYCRCLRSNELRGIIAAIFKSQEGALDPSEAIEAEKEESSVEHENELPLEALSDDNDEKPNHPEPISGPSVTSRLFGDMVSLSHDEDNRHVAEAVPKEDQVFDTIPMSEAKPSDDQTLDFAAGDTDLDFLESTDFVFGEDTADDVGANEPVSLSHDCSRDDLKMRNNTSDSDPVHLTTTTDLTMDIQMNEIDSNHNTKKTPWEVNSTEDNEHSNIVDNSAASASDELDAAIASVESYEDERYDYTTFDHAEDEATDVPAQVEEPIDSSTTQNEDFDCLATSTKVSTDTTEADSFEQEINAVSGDEADDVAFEEQAGADQGYDWSNTEVNESTFEEGTKSAQEVNDEVTFETEATYESGDAAKNVGQIDENVSYTGEGEVAVEETEAAEGQLEIGDGVDADDEEAELFGDWEKGFDPISNHYFWFNHNTGESSWTPPEGWPYEVDEPFSAEDETGGEIEQQEQGYGYEEGATEAHEYGQTTAEDEAYGKGATDGHYYEEEATEAQEYATEGQGYDEGVAGDQYYEGADLQTGENDQHYEEATEAAQHYEEGQYDKELAADDQVYDEQVYEEGPTEEQENTSDDTWHDETADVEQVEQEKRDDTESPRHSEVSDFEFDDSDLPDF